MEQQFGGPPNKVLELLKDRGIARTMAKQAVELAAGYAHYLTTFSNLQFRSSFR
jgi:hypothetical protein